MQQVKNAFFQTIASLQGTPEAQDPTQATRGSYEDGIYQPSPTDVYIARMLLTAGKHVPLPVVDTILDEANYWARSTNEINFEDELGGPFRVHGGAPVEEENKLIIRSLPVGFTHIGHKSPHTNKMASYDGSETKYEHLKQEVDPATFRTYATYPTPSLTHPVRKVVFSFTSRDQGWGGRPSRDRPFEHSSSWMEAGLERFDAGIEDVADDEMTSSAAADQQTSRGAELPECDLRSVQPPVVKRWKDARGQLVESPPEHFGDDGGWYLDHPLHPQPRWTIQANRIAQKAYATYTIAWSYTDNARPGSGESEQLVLDGRGEETGDGEFVRSLKLGDVVTVWAKARFGGWRNWVNKVRVDVYWAL